MKNPSFQTHKQITGFGLSLSLHKKGQKQLNIDIIGKV